MQEHRLGHNILERHLLHWQLFPLFLAIHKNYRTLQEKQVFLFNLESSQYFKNSASSGELFSNHICNTHFSGPRSHELHLQQVSKPDLRKQDTSNHGATKQLGLGGTFRRYLVQLLWHGPGSSFTGSSRSKSHSTWLWMVVGHRQLLWETCSSVSPLSL